MDSMDSEVETLEQRLTSMLGQLQVECGILERMVYKNKNQHRRCLYFQYLMKVRRDIRLLQSAKLEELVGSCFLVITGKRPKQKMVEPMLKAATEISILLARSFFIGFSLTVLALLARLRVLVQQILLDVVSVFNMVSSLAQKKQSVKISQEGIEVFREYYPTNEEFSTLECVWKSDKFVSLERTHKSKTGSQDGDHMEDVPLEASAVKYQSIESFLGDDEVVPDRVDADQLAEKDPSHITENKTDLLTGPSLESDNGKAVESYTEVGDGSDIAATPSKKLPQEDGLPTASKTSPSSNTLKFKSGSRKVAFVSVKNPATSTANVKNPSLPATNVTAFSSNENETNNDNKEDPFFSLLTGGNLKNSLF
uniref:Nucleolus and neural progenitor protein-like N-terminal domain-containing protein n=1 Tax=Fagus sylvatica TaxID=28930 RepID=A0A2N9I328_FAGSY